MSNAIDLARLRHVLAVAETGSFSRAAEAQHITQPALSRSIAAFEAAHAMRLFERGRGGVRQTPAGRFVVERARTLLRSAEAFARDLALFNEGAAGSVAFGMGPMIASLVLADLGHTLLETRPGLEVVSLVKPPAALAADLVEGRVEFVVGHDWMVAELPGLGLEPIGRIPLAVVARAGHPLAGSGTVRAEDLEAFPAARSVRLSSGPSTRGDFVCDDFSVLRTVVAGSDCTWLTAPACLEEDFAEGRLITLDVTGLGTLESSVHVIARAGQPRSPAAEAVVAVIRRMIAERSAGAALSRPALPRFPDRSAGSPPAAA